MDKMVSPSWEDITQCLKIAKHTSIFVQRVSDWDKSCFFLQGCSDSTYLIIFWGKIPHPEKFFQIYPYLDEMIFPSKIHICQKFDFLAKIHPKACLDKFFSVMIIKSWWQVYFYNKNKLYIIWSGKCCDF